LYSRNKDKNKAVIGLNHCLETLQIKMLVMKSNLISGYNHKNIKIVINEVQFDFDPSITLIFVKKLFSLIVNIINSNNKI